jgi:hypothetical protein
MMEGKEETGMKCRSCRWWIVACVVLIAFGCATVQGKWKDAETANTIDAYNKFLKSHPPEEYASKARKKIETLRFDEAKRKNQVADYERFLADYPKSERFQEVQAILKKRMEEVKNLRVKKILVRKDGVEPLENSLSMAAENVLKRMGLECVLRDGADIDGELRIAKTKFGVVGVFTLAGSPHIFMGYTGTMIFHHRQGGAVFEKQVVSLLPTFMRLTNRGGTLVRADPPDKAKETAMMKAAGDRLPVMFGAEIARHFETYFGNGMGYLLEALKSGDPLLQKEAADSLGKLGDRRAIGPLLEALASGSKEVQTDCSNALQKITGQKFGGDLSKWQEWWRQNK